MNTGKGITGAIALRGLSWDLTEDKLTFVQAKGWCRWATSHYLNQCWSESPASYAPLNHKSPLNVRLWKHGRFCIAKSDIHDMDYEPHCIKYHRWHYLPIICPRYQIWLNRNWIQNKGKSPRRVTRKLLIEIWCRYLLLNSWLLFSSEHTPTHPSNISLGLYR